MKNYDEIEELLNGYLDGELDERQQTEIKRLISNDPQIAERLRELESCKKLVNSLGNQSPPEEIIEDIKSALERKTLLQETPARSEPAKGRRELFMRKVVSYAAVILLGAILGTVVYEIIGPTEISNEPQIARRELQQKIEIQPGSESTQPAKEQSAVATSETMQQPDFLKTFEVKVELSTTQPELIASVINNCAKHFPLNFVGPQTSFGNTATLSLGENELEFLLSEINSVLPDKSGFRAELNYGSESTVVENLSFSRFVEFFGSGSPSEIIASTHRAEVSNQLEQTELTRSIESTLTERQDLSKIPKPVLTSDIESSLKKDLQPTTEKIFITIEVNRPD